MRIAVATVRTPFVRGGAELLADGLINALRQRGHDVQLVSAPFHFEPPAEVSRSMNFWKREDLERTTGLAHDLVVCLKFPTYYLNHPRKVVWLAHQHRAVYDLWGTPYDGGLSTSREGRDLKEEIWESDLKALSECENVFAISARVSARLRHYNGIDSCAVYPPPNLRNRIYSRFAEPYIFYPSRLEALKRQDLLIAAMSHVQSPLVALIAGEGGEKRKLQHLITRLGLERRVRLVGQLDEETLLAYYAHSMAVFFGPHDEDYGYVTPEAMLASKPVIICTDSGGPLEFVVPGETGCVVAPDPARVAEAIDQLHSRPEWASELGKAGRERYEALGISWCKVLDSIL